MIAHREKRAILATLPAIFAGINMLDGLTIKQSIHGRLQKSKAIKQAMEALYKNYKLYHNRHKALEDTKAVLAKAKVNDLQALKIRINRHYGDLDILNQNIQNFLTVTNK